MTEVKNNCKRGVDLALSKSLRLKWAAGETKMVSAEQLAQLHTIRTFVALVERGKMEIVSPAKEA